MTSIILIGTETRWGKVVAIGWVGERYYWIINEHQITSMMPASVVEEKK